MKIVSFFLNLPWSLFGLFYGFITVPRKMETGTLYLALIVKVRRLWINELFLGHRVKGCPLGNVVLLSDAADSSTYNHEVVHLEQFTRIPLLFPLFYILESMKSGYRANKYEKLARKIMCRRNNAEKNSICSKTKK